MMSLSCKVLKTLEGKTLVTAESITGGGIGAALTAVPGSSAVYKGGIISYCDEVKHRILGVPEDVLSRYGAVSAQTAQAMAAGARKLLDADVSISVTGLAGPDGDGFGNPVGTVFIGYCDKKQCLSLEYHFAGARDEVRHQTVAAALELILSCAGSDRCS